MAGPIFGRRYGRRQNNSEIGTTETIHDAVQVVPLTERIPMKTLERITMVFVP